MDGLVPPGLNDRSGKHAIVGPHGGGRQIAMQLHLAFLHGDGIFGGSPGPALIRLCNLGNRQLVDIELQVEPAAVGAALRVIAQISAAEILAASLGHLTTQAAGIATGAHNASFAGIAFGCALSIGAALAALWVRYAANG